jgi:hypothetical protein
VLEIYRKRFGRKSLETAASLNELGLALIANGKMLEAEQVNREALEIRRRRFGDENADVATSKDNLAHACNDNGKFTEAEALVREALATRRRLFGNESQEVADRFATLLSFWSTRGRRRKLKLQCVRPWSCAANSSAPNIRSSRTLYDLLTVELPEAETEAQALNGKPRVAAKGFDNGPTWPKLNTISAIACDRKGT